MEGTSRCETFLLLLDVYVVCLFSFAFESTVLLRDGHDIVEKESHLILISFLVDIAFA